MSGLLHDEPAAHSAYRDELGLLAPVPADHGQRRMPAADFRFGPGIGEVLPDFRLHASTGEQITLHAHRGKSKAAVSFVRSAVW